MTTGGTRATFPLMRTAAIGEPLPLGPTALARKRAAIAAYLPLVDKAAALLRADPDALAVESIIPHDYDACRSGQAARI